MEDLNLLQKILEHKKRSDLAEMLIGCKGELNMSTTYGSYWNSILSSYEIHAPLDNYLNLKKISEDDKNLLLESILDIYPHKDEEPEITSISFLLLKENELPVEEITNDEIINIPKSIRLFISYSTKDKILAGKIKTFLSSFGIEVFLAHEDISPSLEWQDVILQNLDSTDIFLPLITNNFKKSKWTDQESGCAVAKNKFIIPISIGLNPYGFLGKYQALKLDESKVFAGTISIVETIMKNGKFYDNMFNLIIESLSKSPTFDDAGMIAEFLSKIEIKTIDNMDKIIYSASKNSQVYYSFRARKALNSLFIKNRSLINKDNLSKLNDLIDDYKFSIN